MGAWEVVERFSIHLAQRFRGRQETAFQGFREELPLAFPAWAGTGRFACKAGARVPPAKMGCQDSGFPPLCRFGAS